MLILSLFFRQLLAEAALKAFNFEIAQKAFVSCSDYQGIQFVKRLQKLTVSCVINTLSLCAGPLSLSLSLCVVVMCEV